MTNVFPSQDSSLFKLLLILAIRKSAQMSDVVHDPATASCFGMLVYYFFKPHTIEQTNFSSHNLICANVVEIAK